MTAILLEDSDITTRATDAQRTFTVRVPASASNLGAGFDCVGIAIDRWLAITADATGGRDGVRISHRGTLAHLSGADSDDLIWRGVVAACAALRRAPPTGITIDAVSDIPVARGLGSSAAAIVAGVMLANALFDSGLDEAAILDIAASLEGHPDNVAPSIYGGAVLTVKTSGHHYHSAPLTVHPSLRFVFLVPDFEVRTEVARAALPAQLDFATAVSAASRAAALVAGLESGDPAILQPALDDLLHVPFRRHLIKGYDGVTGAAIGAGAIGATLSGSGSTVVAIATAETAAAVSDAATRAWRSAGVIANSFITAAESRGAIIETAQKNSGASRFTS